MLFNSYSFLFGYLPIVLIGFFTLCHRHLVHVAKAWLLLSSLFFYGYWDLRFLPLLIGSIIFNYYCGNQILRFVGTSKSKYILLALFTFSVSFRSPARGSSAVLFSSAIADAIPSSKITSSEPSRLTETLPEKVNKAILILGVIANLSLLFYFKYANFFITNLTGSSLTFAEMVLPLGISFFTFTQIAYLIDVSRQKADACDLISYGLFVTVFPHLIAGPILHHKQMLRQFDNLRMYILQWPNIGQGVFLFVLGLSKKVLIADTLSEYVKPIFDTHLAVVPFIQAWFGALTYTLQLYFDFSGYSDMAVGLGLLFNLHLPINFNSPYKADSIIDFWRRWHITLSTFLKDYLYISLGGSRNGKFNHLRNLLLTMLLGGLWHGAGWTFIVWGAAHGFFLVINHLWKDLKMPMPKFAAKSLTLFAVVITWVIFRSPDLSTAQNILEGMFGFNGLGLPLKYESSLSLLKYIGVTFGDHLKINVRISELALVLILFLGVLYTPNSNEWLLKFKRKPQKWAFPCACLFVFCLLCLDDMVEFLYYQF